MATVGYATLEVIPSVKGLRSQLDKQTGGDLAAAGKRGGQRFGEAAGVEAGAGFKSRFSNALRGFSPFAGIAVGAGVTALFQSAVTEASEAEQAIGGVQAVFGEYADQVESDSRRAADALGLSSTAYQQLVTVSGALLKNKGLEDFADQATELIEIGADLAAMFGGTTQEAVEALNAALRGESDPIERYAISLNETAVNAELAKSGMDGLQGAALEQAKTQARLALITQQSADAQGTFARESDTLAGQQQRLTAEWADMRRELGENLLPAVTAFVSGARDMLPVLEDVGGLAKDAVSAFRDLPAPVQAAATAFVALRVASAVGLTTGIASGARTAGTALEGLRIRTMLAADAYRGARTVTRTFGDTSVRVASGVGRLSASLSGVRAAAMGAGGALRSGLSGAMGLLGGPWGLAIAGGTALLAKFWSEHQEAKAHVEELTASLNQQTGAITENTRASVIDRLEKEGLLEQAEQLGLNLGTVTNAALGNRSAMGALRAEYREAASEVDRLNEAGQSNISTEVARRNNIESLIDALGGESAALADAREEARRKAEADRRSEDATYQLRDAAAAYRDEIRNTRTELQKLIAKEQERALAAIQQRRDNIALRETLRAAREEAEKGRKALFDNSRAADANMGALLDLADQWANSAPKVQNARGAYEDMRRKFIDVAEQMGATGREARNLADELLNIPKGAPIRFQSEGYRERMAEIQRLNEALRSLPMGTVLDYTPQGFGSPRANGGPVSPKSTYLVGERGPELFRPTGAGSIIPNHELAKAGGGVQVSIDTVVAHDYRDFMRQTQRRAQKASIGGFGG